MEAKVFNRSPTENIYIEFLNSEDATTPEAPTTPISPGSTGKKPVSAATMNLFVWTDPSGPPFWSGVVPTKVQKTIMVSPEKNEVSYDGVILPSGFSPVTDPRKLSGEPVNGSSSWNILLLLLLLLVIVAIVYFFWWKK